MHICLLVGSFAVYTMAVIEPEPLQQVDRTFVYSRGRKLSYFAGCDYFRLASHPEVLGALSAGLKRYGWNVAASRMTTGNHFLYQALEMQLAGFFEAEAALLVPSGYVTNLAVAQTLTGQFSHVLIDERAHPSLWDAAKAFDTPVLSFRHRSPTALAAVVERCGPAASLVVLTDGMFSHDGSVAPSKEYTAALPSDATLLVDDAHAAGVIGLNGQGSLEYSNLSHRRVIQTITLSKAMGSYGGAILCSAVLRRKIIAKSHLFVGSTPLPLPIVSATLQALTILRREKTLRSKLTQHTAYVRGGLKDRGLFIPETPGPIVAAKPKNSAATVKIQRALLKAAIYPSFISYPNAPATGYFRFVISSEHTNSQLKNLVDALADSADLLRRLDFEHEQTRETEQRNRI